MSKNADVSNSISNAEDQIKVPDEFWTLNAVVHGKTFIINAGDASQRVKWLAHVAIARWDEVNQQGWKKLGIPTVVKAHRRDGNDLDLGAVINEVLENGDTVYVSTSLQPSETII